MQQIKLGDPKVKDEVKIAPFQIRAFCQNGLEFKNFLDQPLLLEFSVNHPFALAQDRIQLPPKGNVQFKVPGELHFHYKVSFKEAGTCQRPRSAIITVLQPVKDPPDGSREPARQTATSRDPAGIVLKEGKQGLVIDPPVLKVRPGEALVFDNQAGAFLNIAFQPAAPFAFGQAKAGIDPLEKINRQVDSTLKFDFEVTADEPEAAAAKGTLLLDIS